MLELPDLFSVVASETTQGDGLSCAWGGLGQILEKGSPEQWLDPGTGIPGQWGAAPTRQSSRSVWTRLPGTHGVNLGMALCRARS